MKLVKHTTTDFGHVDLYGNTQRSSHWGQKHYFLIENASAEELEAIEEMLDAKGWESDGCPCYEDGFTSGFHIDIEEVDAFKADYKAAKKGLKEFMAAQAEAAATEEVAAPAAAEEVEAVAVRAVRREGAFCNYWHTVTDMNIREAAQEWERMHAEALEEDAQRQLDKPAFRAFWQASEFSAMPTAVQAFDAVHAEALALDAEHDAAADLVREAIRIANRDHGHWITGAQVAAMLADGKDYTAAQLARAVVNQAKEAAQLEQYGAQLTTAQQDYTAAQLASVAALDAACEASTDGTEDTPEFAAYEAAEAALTDRATALLQACGRYSVELAGKMGRSAADVEALKAMFRPFYTGNTGSVHPGRVNELVSKALQIDVSATQAR